MAGRNAKTQWRQAFEDLPNVADHQGQNRAVFQPLPWPRGLFDRNGLLFSIGKSGHLDGLGAHVRGALLGVVDDDDSDAVVALQLAQVGEQRRDTLILSRYTELNVEQKLLVNQLKLDLPSQPPPRITAPAGKPARAATQQV